VENSSGGSVAETAGTGVGLQNVRRRLEICYGPKVVSVADTQSAEHDGKAIDPANPNGALLLRIEFPGSTALAPGEHTVTITFSEKASPSNVLPHLEADESATKQPGRTMPVSTAINGATPPAHGYSAPVCEVLLRSRLDRQ
jgi:hypothetical protein